MIIYCIGIDDPCLMLRVRRVQSSVNFLSRSGTNFVRGVFGKKKEKKNFKDWPNHHGPHPPTCNLAALHLHTVADPRPAGLDLQRLDSGAMFTNDERQAERTGRYGTPRSQYLQELVTEFQNTTNEVSKEKIVANLANFAYDPYNYSHLRQLNVLELFLDCITEPNERLVEFGIGGICNSCVDPANAAIIIQCGGIPLAIQCLSSPVKNTVNYALGALYYLCNPSSKSEILKPEVVEVIRRYAAAEAVSVSFSNLANAFLDKHANR